MEMAEPERSVSCFALEEEDGPRRMGPVLIQMAIRTFCLIGMQ